MTAAYAALADKLDGAAKVHFEADQARWRAGLPACDVQPAYGESRKIGSRFCARAWMLKPKMAFRRKKKT